MAHSTAATVGASMADTLPSFVVYSALSCLTSCRVCPFGKTNSGMDYNEIMGRIWIRVRLRDGIEDGIKIEIKKRIEKEVKIESDRIEKGIENEVKFDSDDGIETEVFIVDSTVDHGTWIGL